MSLADTFVQMTDNGDGSAKFTHSFADDDHRFSVSVEGDTAVLSYEETLSWRGAIVVAEPDESVYKEVMQSEEMTDFLEDNDLEGVRRDRNS